MANELLSVGQMKVNPGIFVATGVAAALLCGLPPPAAAQVREPKLDRALQNAPGGSRQRVIVRFKAGAGTSVEQKVLSKGNKVFSKHPSIGAFTAELSGDQLAELARDPNVESIGADADVAAFTSTSTDTSISSSVLRNTLGENEGSKGAGIGVAVIDSGIAPLPAFNGRITASYDLTTGVPIAVPAGDEYGHGTHVAGLIGANDANYMGVAPSVTFVSLKVLNRNG